MAMVIPVTDQNRASVVDRPCCSMLLSMAVLLLGGVGTPHPIGTSAAVPSVGVTLLRTPDGGIQPQAAVDAAGTVHLLYFNGDPAHGDLFYARLPDGAAAFTPAVRVNSEPGSVIATGSVRGGQMALGRAGFVHVAWNASRPVEREGLKELPMWYARLRPGARTFEPQRAIGSHTRHLDGGGSVAADAEGRVHVVWHAAGNVDGETHRRIFVAMSADDGGRFSREAPFGDAAGLCGCCQLETLVDRRGQLNVLYRAAGDAVHRDAMWLRVVRGRAAAPIRLQTWELPACPMTTFAMTHRGGDIVAAWETQQQIYSAVLTPESRRVSATRSMSGTALRKHPSVAVNAAGGTLYAWTEGTAWARGGTVAWELRSGTGTRVASASSAGEVPVWSLVAAVARADGSFLLIH
jgi:hypothetical protein